MSALVDTTPAGIVNAARCFISCVPVSQRLALKTYLLTQFGNAVTPPCVTPTAPTSAGAKSIGNTTVLISWSQPSNAGSFIKNYIVYWGTTSGVYTNNSGLLPATPRLYTISGLTTGTTYFWVVQAVAFSGCNSAVSSEKSATTTGASPSNGLLQSLVSYWKFDNVSSVADSIGANTWTLAGGTANQPGIINQAVSFNSAINTGFNQAALASLQGGAGVSFTIQVWFEITGALNPFATLFARWSGVVQAQQAYALYLNGGNVVWAMRTATNTYFAISAAQPAIGSWAHMIVGYDAVNGQIFFQMNNGARQVQATTSDIQTSVAPLWASGGTTIDAGNDALQGEVDECAWWNRVLSTTDVGILYNAGAGTPLSNFGA